MVVVVLVVEGSFGGSFALCVGGGR